MIKIITWIIIVWIIFIGSYLIMTDSHEQAHARICESFNGEVTEYHVGLTNSHIVCKGMSGDNYKLAQAGVDSFGYQLQGFVDVLIILFGVWLFIKMEVIK